MDANAGPAQGKRNGPGGLLVTLLQGENGQKLLMALVVLAGGGNLWQGHQAEVETREDFARAISEIHAIANGYQTALETQKKLDTQVKTALANQQIMLDSIKKLEQQAQKNP
jgi:hypothetical protein